MEIIVRPMTEDDIPILSESLKNDEYHSSTSANFFYPVFSDGTKDLSVQCNVYEDSKGPIMFVRGTKALRLDIQFLNNEDKRRNALVMGREFKEFAQRARMAGFTEVVFNTSSPQLKEFCTKVLGFTEAEGSELRFFL